MANKHTKNHRVRELYIQKAKLDGERKQELLDFDLIKVFTGIYDGNVAM